MIKRLRIYLILYFILAVHAGYAQTNFSSPDEFLGYTLGKRFTPHHKVVDYFKHIAESSPNVNLEQYGETYENRPLIVAYISSKENLARLDKIRENNLKRTGLEKGNAPNDGPAIVWLSYNVHGNESVSTEASMAVLYTLAAKKDERVQEWLNKTVIILDPAVNPDGRDRYVNWYNQVASTPFNVSPDAIEHQEPWPGGRPNHYLFDLNRDWAWQTQVESQQRMALYNQWLPHIHADFHEQGVDDPYYFAPAAEPFHKYITDWQREFQTTIGLNNTRYFDENAWLYFTRERFDLFYPSYGDTYPTFNGAIGMTYEQGGSGRAGLGVITADKDTLTLVDRIAHHYTTSLSTIEATADNADKVVENFEGFYKKSQANPPGQYKSYLISKENDADKLKSLKNLLDLHQIQYSEASQNKTYRGWSYLDAEISSFRSNAGDLVISAYQPKAVLLQVLFEPNSKLSDSITYDITAWSVPYMMGLEAYATTDRIPAGKVSEAIPFKLTIENNKPYAYILPWKGMEDARFLARLLREGIKVRFAEEPFVTNGQEYKAGTLIIARKGNDFLGERFDYIVREAATEWERPLQAVGTGFVAEGKDFGSGSVHLINKPNVAVVAGNNVSSLGFGEVWHFFEQQLNYPVTVVRDDYLNRLDLAKYDVLILPNGGYHEMNHGLKDKLTQWVERGGKLILMQNAVSLYADKGEAGEAEDKIEEKGDTAEFYFRKYANRERESISSYNPGSIYRVHLDNTHPLAFGYSDSYFSLKTDSESYKYLKDGWNVGTIRSEKDLISGFVGEQLQETLAKSLVFGVEEKGSGQIVYFVDNPLFRAFWENGKLFFTNAVFFVGQ